MMQLPFFNKPQKISDKFLSVNINARDIRVLAFYYDRETLRIIGSGVQALEEGSVRNGIIIEKEEVAESLKIATAQATQELEETISDIIIGVDGGICIGITTTVRSVKSPGLITENEIQALYNKLREAAYIQAKNKTLHITGDPDSDLKVVTTKDIYIKIDNNIVPSLNEMSGTNIEIAQFNAFAPSFHIKSLESIAKKNKLNVVAIGSQAYALTQWVTASPNNISDFVLINISEDATDVGIVFGGGIVSTQSLHIGFMHFIEGISMKMGLTKQESANVLEVYMLEKLTGSEMDIVKGCINEVLKIWLDGIILLFEEFSDVKTFAPKIYLTGYGVEIPDVFEAIKNEPWTKSIPFKSPPEFTKLSFTQLNKISDSTGKSQTSDWLNTAASSIIYDEVFGKQV